MVNIETKLYNIYTLQDRLNSLIIPDWKSQNIPYERAALVEAVECMDHIGWKWWKKQTPNMVEAKRELVDILHFIVSLSHRDEFIPIRVVNIYKETKEKIKETTNPEVWRCNIELLIGELCPSGSWVCVWQAYFTLCLSMGVDFDHLYKEYIKKYALNQFRQENGYKDGTYVLLNGKEDNEYLEEIDWAQLPEDLHEAINYIKTFLSQRLEPMMKYFAKG